MCASSKLRTLHLDIEKFSFLVFNNDYRKICFDLQIHVSIVSTSIDAYNIIPFHFMRTTIYIVSRSIL